MVISEKASPDLSSPRNDLAFSGSSADISEAINAAVDAAVSTALLAKSGNGPTMLKENLLNVKVAKEYYR